MLGITHPIIDVVPLDVCGQLATSSQNEAGLQLSQPEATIPTCTLSFLWKALCAEILISSNLLIIYTICVMISNVHTVKPYQSITHIIFHTKYFQNLDLNYWLSIIGSDGLLNCLLVFLLQVMYHLVLRR